MKRLAVIPARGGSTRLPDKNITPLGGKPLIRWAVEAVVNSDCFDKVIVSTDSDKIFNCVSDLPVHRHIRPPEHATVKATALNAMLNLMENHEKYDVFSYFLPTCPFVSPEDIKKGVSLLDEKTDSVISVTEFLDTPQLACIMRGSNVIPMYDNLTSGLTNSKYIQKYHRPSGAFHISWWNNIIKNKNFFKGNVRGVVMPKERSVDIDDKFDMFIAESMLLGEAQEC